MGKQNNLHGVENQRKWMPPPRFVIEFYIKLTPCGAVVSTRGGYSGQPGPPLWHTPRNVRVWGPHEPNFSVFTLVAAWGPPWQPYTQMKALVLENNLNRCRVGHLLWVGGIFEKCRCEHGPKGVCHPHFSKMPPTHSRWATRHQFNLSPSTKAFIWV